jgi:hypothetical protein
MTIAFVKNTARREDVDDGHFMRMDVGVSNPLSPYNETGIPTQSWLRKSIIMRAKCAGRRLRMGKRGLSSDTYSSFH